MDSKVPGPLLFGQTFHKRHDPNISLHGKNIVSCNRQQVYTLQCQLNLSMSFWLLWATRVKLIKSGVSNLIHQKAHFLCVGLHSKQAGVTPDSGQFNRLIWASSGRLDVAWQMWPLHG